MFRQEVKPRTSVGGGNIGTPDAVKRRGSLGGGREGTPGAQQLLDRPVFPVTVEALRQSIAKGLSSSAINIIYGSQISAISIVGWVESEIRRRSGEFVFWIRDITGAVRVVIDVRAEDEDIIEKCMSEINIGTPVRVMGTAIVTDVPNDIDVESTEKSKGPQIHAFHIRRCPDEEFAYYHYIECAYVYMRENADDENTREGLNKLTISDHAPHTPIKDEEGDAKVTLPDTFASTDNLCERHILKYILDYRKKDVGVAIEKIVAHLSKKFTRGEILESMKCIEERGDIFPTIDEFMDILTDE
eukprot:GHVO01050467.1.p1 GENE.GHVO01050467.1~~GHVO01050467.1.p1  ORF type:complete len:301 (+),score=72.62 GHVO01050467.1:29-931(+)